MEDIPGQKVDGLKKRLQGVSKALKKSINRQLFPDFRHKHNLVTGKPYAGEAGAITLAPPPEVQWNPPYPPADSPNLKDATAQAQLLVAGLNKTGSYPALVDGVTSNNVWAGLLGPDVYSLAVNALNPQDPFFAQQDPVYNYCGKFVGYTSTVVSGDETAAGGDPTAGSDPNPPNTTFNILWITDRNCWAVNGVQSEQVVHGRRDIYLDANPTIEIRRGYNHILSIPSYDHLGDTLAPEFYICYVDENLKPRVQNGAVVKFNQGLSRLETYELLEDANGLDGEEGESRRRSFPTGTNLYFAAENKVYTGYEPPAYPSELVWWTNLETCVTQKWVLNRITDPVTGEVLIDGTGNWVEVTDAEQQEKWVGSSNNVGDPHVNYLAYSNRDGTVFGLLKLV